MDWPAVFFSGSRFAPVRGGGDYAMRMAVRHAVGDDVADVLPLMRAYCDFYESNPTDGGLDAMVRDVIKRPEDEAFLLVAEDGDEIVGFAACQWKWSSLRGARI